MGWIDEAAGWLSGKLVIDEARKELDRIAGVLRKDDVGSRLAGVKQLTYMRAADAVPLLIGALKDAEPEVRGAAAKGLAYKLATEAVMPIAVALGDADPGVRAHAIEALDEIGQPRARGRIARLLRGQVVSVTPDPRIPDLLARSLADADSSVRMSALSVLPRHGARGVVLTRENVATASGKERESFLQAIRPELNAALEARDAGHRRAAVETLHTLYGEEAIHSLAEALDDASPEVRQAAVDAVTALGPRPALPELLARLGDSDEGVVVKVIEGLVCVRNLKTFNASEEDQIHDGLVRLAKYRQGRVQAVAAWALGAVGQVASVGTLCDLVVHQDAKVASAAIEALGKINDPRAVGPLTDVLRRALESGGAASAAPAPETLARAAESLAKADDVRAVPHLVELLFLGNAPPVDTAVDAALAAMSAAPFERARAGLESADPAVRIAAVRQAIGEPRLALRLMQEFLTGPTPEIREAARDVLRKQGVDLEGLCRRTLALADKSPNPRVLAIHLAVALKLTDAYEMMERLLSDTNEPDETWLHAVQALTDLGSADAKKALEKHRGHSREAVRSAIAKSLG